LYIGILTTVWSSDVHVAMIWRSSEFKDNLRQIHTCYLFQWIVPQLCFHSQTLLSIHWRVLTVV